MNDGSFPMNFTGPTKLGERSLREAFRRGIALTFRAEHIHEDAFACRAEWEEEGKAYYALGKRFRCLSDRKADFLAEQLMVEKLASWTKENA